MKITASKFSKRHLIEKQSLFYLIQFKNVSNILNPIIAKYSIIFLFLIQKPISNLGKINVLKAEFHDKSSFVVQNILVELT